MLIIQYGYNDELYHHGILGMHWGIRRYQPYPKGYNGSGKEVGQAKRTQKQPSKFQQRKAIKQAEKERATKLEEARKMKAQMDTQKAHEENRQKVLRSGSAKEVLAYKGELTNSELKNVIDRLGYEQKLADISAKEMKTFMKSMDQTMQSVQTITNWAKIGTDTYNTLARIYNATEKGKKNPWNLVQQEQGGGKKDKKKD